MSKHRPFSPISHHFNRDVEVIQLRKKFGDWMALAWQELLHEADRNDGIVAGNLDQIAVKMAPVSLQMYQGRAANAARTALEYMENVRWITVHSDHVDIVNHWKYHRNDNAKMRSPNLPNQPNPTTSHKNEKIVVAPLAQKPKKTKTIFPQNFELKADLILWAVNQGIDNPEKEIEAFRDYHVSKANRFLDWNAAFRTWLRNSKRFNRNNGNRAEQAEGELSERSKRMLRRGL